MPAKRSQTATKPVSLNSEQQAVVDARNGAWRVLATAGAGKSECLTQRYAGLIQEGRDPNQILSLTFTSTGAKNLRDRVEQRVGKIDVTRKGAGASTLHSLALTFATEERAEFPYTLAEFPLAPEPIAYRMAAEAGKRFEIDARVLRPAVSLWKRNRVTPAEAIKEAEAKGNAKLVNQALAYKKYNALCAENGVLDFDSLMSEMVTLLEKKPQVLDRFSFEWVMCDEAQDCCSLDWQLLRLLTRKHNNVMAVGDSSQAIYGFRGSSTALFLNMHEMFPDVRTLLLSCNFRSTPEIVDYCRPFACEELSQNLKTHNPSGPVPRILGFKNPGEEAAFVVKEIKEALCG